MGSRTALALVLLLAVVAALPTLTTAQQPGAQKTILFVDDSVLRGNEVTELLGSVAARNKRAVAGVHLFVPFNVNDEQIGVLAARIASYPEGTPVWLFMPGPLTGDAIEPWRARLQRVLTTAAKRLSTLEIQIGAAPPDVALFTMRITATEARAQNSQVQIALRVPIPNGGPSYQDGLEQLREVYVSEMAPYVDRLVIHDGLNVEPFAAFLAKIDPTADIISGRNVALEPSARAAVQCHENVLWGLGGKVNAFAWDGTTAMVEACITSLEPAMALITGDVLLLDAASAGLVMRVDGQDVRDKVRARLLFDQEQQSTWLLYSSPHGVVPLDIDIRLATDGRPTLVDLVSLATVQPMASDRDPSTGLTHVRLPPTGKDMLLGFNEGASTGFTERTGVTAARKLSVEEIIAKHQQQQLAQDAVVQNYVASARTEQHFRPTVTDSGYDVVSENVYFVDRDGIEWEERAFFVNGSRWGADRPPFPLLQPEKVLSLPLALRLGDDYRYTLVGESTVDDVPCYEVDFEPIHTERSLYKGTVWIDRDSFARVRVHAVQTKLSAPVVSNDETQTYRTVTTIDGRPVVLLTEVIARQIVMIAGRNLMLEKRAQFDSFRVNADDFADLRQAARASDGIMFRETDRGLRYYNKEGGTRVVSERGTTHAKAMAMGVLLDPSYTFPLPIFGINYLNFEFNGRQDTQLAILFAGVLAAGNIQRPKLGRTPLDASVDFFAIAPPATDRLFDGKEEREDQRLLTWPLSTSVNLGWQANAFLKVSAQYQFRFDGYVRDRTTEESFTVPSSTTTNGIGGAWEYRRGGYSIVANGTLFRRSSWKTWGADEDLQTSDDSRARYAKYSVIVSRDFNIDAFQKIHVDAGLFGGRHLDRFSRYQFGMFDDTRIHGVPASGIRFDDLRMVRGSYSFNLFEQYRLDLFLEQAWGRDRPAGPDWHPLTGTGVGVNMRAPWHTILRVDFGHSFLPDRYSGLGSTTLQVMLLKPLK